MYADHRGRLQRRVRRRHRAGAVVLVLVFIAAACGTQRARSLPADMTREVSPLPLTTVSSADARVLLQVEASGQPTIERITDADAYRLTVAIGAETPIRCVIGLAPLPVASEIAASYAELPGPPAKRHVLFVEAGMQVDMPTLYAEFGAATRNDKAVEVTFRKVVGILTSSGIVFCVHSEPGYRQSFRRITSALVASLQVQSDPAATPNVLEVARPEYEEIWVSSIGSIKYGVSSERVYRLSDGGRQGRSRSMYLMGGSDDELLGNDQWGSWVAAADGTIQRANEEGVRRLSTSTASDMRSVVLTREPGGVYVVEGKAEGKDVNGRISSKKPLLDQVQRWHAIRAALRRSPDAVTSFLRWDGLSSPLEFIETTYQPVQDDSGPRRIERRVGDAVAVLTLDEQGVPLRTEPVVPTSGATFFQERVFMRGNADALLGSPAH